MILVHCVRRWPSIMPATANPEIFCLTVTQWHNDIHTQQTTWTSDVSPQGSGNQVTSVPRALWIKWRQSPGLWESSDVSPQGSGNQFNPLTLEKQNYVCLNQKFFHSEIIIIFLVSSFSFIWIPMLYGHYKYFNSFSAGTVFIHQNYFNSFSAGTVFIH